MVILVIILSVVVGSHCGGGYGSGAPSKATQSFTPSKSMETVYVSRTKARQWVNGGRIGNEERCTKHVGRDRSICLGRVYVVAIHAKIDRVRESTAANASESTRNGAMYL